MRVQQLIDAWQDAPSTDEKEAVVEGSNYNLPIQIEIEEDWQRQLMERRSPADGQERSSDGGHPLAQDYPLEREPASTLTWESFMDTVAFPEKSIPGAVRVQDWTQGEARDALLETCQDTVLCGALMRQQDDFVVYNEHRAMMDDILDEEEF